MSFNEIKPLLQGIREEIKDLESEAKEAQRTGHHEASVIYEFSAMRFRVLLQNLGYAEPSKRVIDGEKDLVVKPFSHPNLLINRQELISAPSIDLNR
ncbi:hypothetical protein AB4454_07025 [Vibrio artabrorum]|uniref:hypothetical protein n=1 Tax=Vibrio artabrorum TaxID=446374 RepID=UPI00354C4E4B